MKLVLIEYRERFRRVLMAHTGYNELSAPDQSVVLGAGAPKAIALCSGMYKLKNYFSALFFLISQVERIYHDH